MWSAEEEAQLQELYLAHKDVEGVRFGISRDFEGGSLGPRLLLTAPFPLHHRSRCSGNHLSAPEICSSNTQAGHPPSGADGPGQQRQGVPEEVKA